MGGGGEGGRNEGGGKELIETVLTCEGNISDPELPLKITCLVHHLRAITNCEESSNWLVRKVEPWNSVRVTFSIPKEAADRLHQLAQAGDAALRQLGILSVQVEGDQVISLKVAGLNHETTEILLRTEGIAGPSSEGNAHSSVARSVTQALSGVSILTGFEQQQQQHQQQQQQQQHHQQHPVSQFPGPSSVGSDGIPVLVGRNQVVQQRPPGSNYAYSGVNSTVMHPRHVQPQQTSLQSPASVLVSGGQLSHTAIVTRPVFPNNPPPPYPSQELRQSVPQHQVSPLTQVNGQQFVVAQTSSVVSPSPQNQVKHISQQSNALTHTMTGNYRVASSQVSVANSASASAPNRGQVRTQVSMIKNSPLLVGLLQQPEQPSPIVGTRNKCVTNSSQSTVTISNSTNSVENGPIPSVMSSTSSGTVLGSAGTYIGRSKDGLTTHQHIYSGGSVITNSAPPPPPPPLPRQHLPTSGLQHLASLSGQPSPSSPASRLQTTEDHRRIMAVTSVHSSRNKSGHLQSAIKEEHKESSSTHSHKKESQYLINPNTGLLEPRPNTDSSDSEPEGRTESPTQDNPHSNSVPSDNESNLSATSRKETDHSDSDVSRVSIASVESKKVMSSDRGLSQERDSSPASSWENMISSSPGEKIRLRLKLGKEQVAQATIVGNANKKVERKELPSPLAASINSPSMSEPRVPKLHIKLHSSQPVIIKSMEENEASTKKSLKDLASLRDDKIKRKGGRSKPRNSETDFESFRSKNLKLKVNKDKLCGDEVSSQVLKILESKKSKHESDFEESSFLRFKESDNRLKVSKMMEVTKHSKVDKLRTRLKKPPMRKVGDLNSVGGEITSHKILETLPPSITKVAAIHTQQPHRNPNSLSPVPFSSISTNMFGGSSISASFSSSTTTSPSSNFTCSPLGDTLKAELEKRGSEIIPKTEKIEVEKSSSDILMTKLCMSNPNLKNLMNGDVSHSEKVTINQMRFKRAGSLASQADFPSASKLTIKRKNSEETHTLKALKKEGLGPMPTFLNSSVLINKVSPDKSSISSLSGPHRQNEDLTEKLLKKVESIKGPLRGEIAGLKSNSDITIHSVSKNDILGLTKASSDFERRADLINKIKPEVTKVGRVTCVDVMDRKALEEALKSSRNSSKKNDISFCKSTTSMVDRLRRWNSIDSSNTVPLNTHSQQQTSDSTNLNSTTAVKTDSKEPDEGDGEKLMLSNVTDKVKSDPCISQQSNTINVNSDKDCDNSDKDNVDKALSFKSENNVKCERLGDSVNMEQEQSSEPSENKQKYEFSCETTKSTMLTTEVKPQCSFESGDHEQNISKLSRDCAKIPELVSSVSSVKAEVDSPEGTPKGDNGNAQGGEDSGIESMDALSEKSPNHSDQSPNRREEKDCEIFQEKCKLKTISTPSKGLKTEEKEIPPKVSPTLEDIMTSETHIKNEQVQNSNLVSYKSTLEDNNCKLQSKIDNSCGTTCENLNMDVLSKMLPDKNTTDKPTTAYDEHQNNEFNYSVASKSLDNLLDTYQTVNISDEKNISLTKPPSSSPIQAQINQSNETFGVMFQGCSSPEEYRHSDELQGATLSESLSSVNLKSDSISGELLCSSQEKFSDLRPVELPADVIGNDPSNKKLYSTDIPVTSVFCSSSMSITTTSISTASPKSSVVTSSSIFVHPSPTLSHMSVGGMVVDQSSSKDSSQSTLLPNSKDVGVPFCSGFKPSLLAITLSRPPGSSIISSQIGTSIANSNYEKLAASTNTARSTSGTTATTTTTTSKIGSVLDTQSNNSTSIVYCHSLSCNNNSLAYCNSFAPTTNTTMIILAASTNSCSSVMTATPNSTKVVTLKPGVNQSNNSAINPPVGKTFRLVALPGINSMTPAASPVKGQLVTLKPVVGSGIVPSITKNSQLLQSTQVKTEEQISSTLKASLSSTLTAATIIPPADIVTPPALTSEPVSNEGHLDLDFVGFSSSTEADQKDGEVSGKTQESSTADKSNIMTILSPLEEEPTPMRVHPPLYTYGNRERKKELESDAEEKDREDIRDTQNLTHTLASSKLLDTENDVELKDEFLKVKSKDKKLHELTIEIPIAENYPDDKRFTRSTRQSTRLASPKVNSPAGTGELSPRSDKKSPANIQAMGKPSPLGMVKSSVSPALRIGKRRRHESESSNASNISEDQTEPMTKTSRRKGTLDVKEEGKWKSGKKDSEFEREKEMESSDDESLHEDDSNKKKPSLMSNTEEEEETRPSSRSGRVSKAATRTRDRTVTSESSQGSRDTTPTRRTARQNRVTSSSSSSITPVHNQANSHDKLIDDRELDASKDGKEKLSVSPAPENEDQMSPKDGEKKITEKKWVPSPSGKEGIKPPQKGKRENETEAETPSGRRKTRSTTNTVNEDVKRRRLSKDK